MKKEEFLKLLRSKLDVLEDREIEDIMEEYQMHIEEKMKDGTKEEKVIKSFGNIDDLVKDILGAYKISDKYVKKEYNTYEGLDNIVNNIVAFFQNMAKGLIDQKSEEIGRTIVSFIILFIIILLMRIPFYLFELIGTGVFAILPSYVESLVIFIWKVLIECSYFGLGIFIIYYAVKHLIIDKKQEEINPDKVEKKSTSSIKCEKPVVTIIEDEKEKQIRDNSTTKELGKLFLLIIRIFLTFLTIPFFFCAMGLTISFGVLVLLAFQGIYLVGLLILLLGLILVSNSFLFMMYHLIWKGR